VKFNRDSLRFFLSTTLNWPIFFYQGLHLFFHLFFVDSLISFLAKKRADLTTLQKLSNLNTFATYYKKLISKNDHQLQLA
jgi:hypothetical protein